MAGGGRASRGPLLLLVAVLLAGSVGVPLAALVPGAPATHAFPIAPFGTPPTYQNGAFCATTSGGTCTTSGLSVSSGYLLVVVTYSGGKNPTNWPTDSSGDHFKNESYCRDTATGGYGATQTLFVSLSPATGSSVTFSFDNNATATDQGVWASTVSGSTGVDVAGTCQYSTGPGASYSITANDANDLYVVSWATSSSTSPACSAKSGSTASQNSLSGYYACLGYQSFTGSGSNTIQVNWGSAVSYDAVGISLAPGSSAPTCTLTASPATTQVGEHSTLSYTISGGTSPYTWTLAKNGSSSNLSGAGASSYTFTPSGAATYTFYFNVTDHASNTCKATATVVVDAALVASLSASPATTQAGEASTLSYSFTGGVSPITWTLTKNGSSSNLTGASGGHYTFSPSYAGTYTFYLNATDAVGSTSKVTATVTVDAALAASLSASPSTTQVGEHSTLSYSFTGGVSPITWTLTRNGSASNLSGASGGHYTFSPSYAGTYTFYLNATDAVGSTSKVTATVVVKAALVASLSASPATTQVGEASTLTYSFTGGVTPITWTLTRNGSASNLSGATSTHYVFTPSYAATYTFYLNATDAVGSTSKVTATVTVRAALVASLSASPATTQVGEASVLSYSFTGGVSPITWTLARNGSASNLTGASGGHYSFSPSYAALYTFYLNSTDAVGSVSKATATVTVQPALAVTLSASPATTQVGESSTLTYTISGGVVPISWTLARNGSASNLTGASGGHYTFHPSYAATYTFYFNATDTVGSTSKATATVTVKAALVASLSASPTTTQVGEASVLSYSLTGGVSPITWTLARNGSASNLTGASGGHYSFSPSYAGTYTFYLNASDAVGSTSKVTATVTVEPALVASLSASPSTTQVGEAVTLTYSYSGGVAPVTWTLAVNGSSSNLTGASGGHYTFHPSYAGTYTFFFNATDAVGSTSKVTAVVTVKGALAASLSASPTEIEVGQSSTLTYTLAGGVSPITWTLTRNGSATNLTGASGGHYAFTPAFAGTYTFYLNSTDAVGSVSKATATVTVEPQLIATLSASPTTTQVGEASTLSYSFSGGISPVTWTLTRNGSASNLTGASGGHYTFHPSYAGTYTFYLNATDALGGTSKPIAVVTVKGPLVASLTASPTEIAVGQASVLSYSFAGGVAPYTWTLTKNGSASNLSGASGGRWSFSPLVKGNYTFYLNATDAVGSVSKAEATVRVVNASTVFLLPPTDFQVLTYTNSTITLTWWNYAQAVTNVTLYYAAYAGSTNACPSARPVNAAENTSQWTFVALPASTEFCFQAVLWDVLSRSAPSAPFLAATSGGASPATYSFLPTEPDPAIPAVAAAVAGLGGPLSYSEVYRANAEVLRYSSAAGSSVAQYGACAPLAACEYLLGPVNATAGGSLNWAGPRPDLPILSATTYVNTTGSIYLNNVTQNLAPESVTGNWTCGSRTLEVNVSVWQHLAFVGSCPVLTASGWSPGYGGVDGLFWGYSHHSFHAISPLPPTWSVVRVVTFEDAGGPVLAASRTVSGQLAWTASGALATTTFVLSSFAGQFPAGAPYWTSVGAAVALPCGNAWVLPQSSLTWVNGTATTPNWTASGGVFLANWQEFPTGYSEDYAVVMEALSAVATVTATGNCSAAGPPPLSALAPSSLSLALGNYTTNANGSVLGYVSWSNAYSLAFNGSVLLTSPTLVNSQVLEVLVGSVPLLASQYVVGSGLVNLLPGVVSVAAGGSVRLSVLLDPTSPYSPASILALLNGVQVGVPLLLAVGAAVVSIVYFFYRGGHNVGKGIVGFWATAGFFVMVVVLR